MILFKPGNQSLFIDYPELKDVREFAVLSPEQLLFTWYYANPTSPHYKEENLDAKTEQCINASFKRMKPGEREKWKKEFPKEIRDAIKRWEFFNPGARLKAKEIAHKTFETFEKMTNLPEEKLKKMNIYRKKKFIELSSKIIDYLPILIKQLEYGFAVSDEEEKPIKEENNISMMEKIISEC